MTAKRIERRKHPRRPIAVDGHITCHVGGDPVTLRTRNISCSGLYCHVPRYVAPFTRVNVAMALPLRRRGGAPHNETFAIEGVVVRTEPEQETPGVDDYRVAIFFSGLTEEARDLLARYVIAHDGGA